MEPSVLQVLHRIEAEDTAQRAEVERGVVFDLHDFIQSLHPDSSKLVHILVQSVAAKRLLEIGASRGYSTIWLAHAARLTGGRVTSLEVHPPSVETARRNLAEAGLEEYVDFVLGDARETLPALEGHFDFALLDCWDRLYPEVFPLLVPLLRPGALLVSDNVTAGTDLSDEFLEMLHGYSEMETVSVPIGRDIEVSVKRGAEAPETDSGHDSAA